MFPQRSRPALLMPAAWGGLKSAPDSRLRRASRHLLYSLLRRTATHPGDLVAQFRLAWSNLKDALAAAGMDPTNIVRLNMYTTDVDGFMAAAGQLVPIFAEDGCKPVGTLLGVTRLFEPEIMVELEATAVA